ncbi:MAG: DUF7289 family protein [Candidatus Methanospirareceae archaeon]
MRSRGVSEVVGYLLVFSIVVTIVSVIYVSGMPMVERTKENSALQSMKTVFITMQSNINKVAFGQSPVRTMKLNLIKGGISTNKNAGTITVNGQTIQFGNIEYTLGARRMIYELGAVIESTPGGSIIISDPPIFFTNDSENAHVFISVINVSGDFSAGGGIAEMQICSYNVSSDTHVYNSSDYVTSLNISVTSQYQDAWDRYLKKEFGFPIPSCNLTLVSHNVTVS